MRPKYLIIGAVSVVAVLATVIVYFSRPKRTVIPTKTTLSIEQAVGANSDVMPEIEQEVLVRGLTKPWDVDVSEEGDVFFTEKEGTIAKLENGTKQILAKPDDVLVRGEAGMMGMTLDSDFKNNRYIYACFASTKSGSPDIRVVRWRVGLSGQSLIERNDILTGIPYNDSTFPGRHSGCRPRMDDLGRLWVGTGDVAVGTHPQDPASLGGKLLRVDRNGQRVVGNMSAPFDERIYSYGHRNIQGVAIVEGSNGETIGYTAEHGPDVDDEINLIQHTSGSNYGWNPIPGYNESVSMTDTEQFPDAIKALWSSGDKTLAVSGSEYIRGADWGILENALAVATLKAEHLRVLFIEDNRVTKEIELVKGIGRIRSVVQAPDGNLYVTTDNGSSQDVIIVLRPVLR